MILIVNGHFLPINESTKLVNACAIYTDLKIRLIFDKEPFSVRFTYLSYVLQFNIKDYLIQKNFIQNMFVRSE